MMHFAWPWVFIILPLPWLIRRFFPAVQTAEQSALKVPFLDDFKVAETEFVMRAQKPWVFWLAIFAWCLLVVASSRPQWLGEPIEQGVSGRDLMLAVDLSWSMKMRDFIVNGEAVDRLTATKVIASKFIQKRVGDRIGLILFGEHAYIQSPLTFDRKTVQVLLNESALGLAGDSTAIGDTIGLAIKRLKSQEASSRVLILLTDGDNRAGIDPLKAAELAVDYQLKVYTIGMGAEEVTVGSGFFARKVNPSRDLDEKTLTAIAEKTGGQYFRARDTAELTKIYQMLDELEPVEKDKQYFRPRSELFFWPLGLALIITFLISVIRLRTL